MFGVLGIIIYNQSIGGEHNANTRTDLCIIFLYCNANSNHSVNNDNHVLRDVKKKEKKL